MQVNKTNLIHLTHFQSRSTPIKRTSSKTREFIEGVGVAVMSSFPMFICMCIHSLYKKTMKNFSKNEDKFKEFVS